MGQGDRNMENTHLSIDIETRSSADISKTGLYRYAQQEDFEILLFAYKYGNEEVKIIDIKSGEEIPAFDVNNFYFFIDRKSVV